MSNSLFSDAPRFTARRARSIGLCSFAAACALLWAGCGGVVEVGDAKDDPREPEEEPSAGSGNEPEPTGPAPTTPTPTPSTPAPTVPEPPDCTTADATKRANYDTLRALPNALGELVGKSFTGYLEGGPDVELIVDASGNATFYIGEPAAPPVADEGYLCGNRLQDGSQCARYYRTAMEGAVYPVHGARYADGRLRVPLQVNEAYDEWCSLQTPHDSDSCFFRTLANVAYTDSPANGQCFYGSESADCGWLELGEMGICTCTSTECFASLYEDAGFNIDARWNESTGEFSGSFIGDRDGPQNIYLVPAAP